MDYMLLPVAVAVIKDSQGRILIAKRHDPETPECHEKWEFIGGKLEFNETPEQAVVREVEEESGLQVKVEKLLPQVFINTFQKKDKTVLRLLIIPYLCSISGGKLQEHPHDPKITELRFIDPAEADQYEFLPKVKEIISLVYPQ